MKIVSRRGRAAALTAHQVSEVQKCFLSPIYFINNYVKYQHPRFGAAQTTLYPYQEVYVANMHIRNKVVVKMPRQTGCTSVALAYLLWELIFKTMNTSLAVAPNWAKTQQLKEKFNFAFENLPDFLKQAVLENNQSAMRIANGSRILFSIISANTARGMSLNRLYVDNLAFADNSKQIDFLHSILPCLSSASACLITSTPNGSTNAFADLWLAAERGVNGFHPLHVKVDDIKQWDAQFITNMKNTIGDTAWRREYECELI